MNHFFSRNNIDNIGTCLSIFCAIHCLATPLLIIILPLVGLGILVSEPMELIIIGSIIVFACSSLIWGYKYHKKLYALLLLLTGIVVLVISHLSLTGLLEIVMHVTAGLCLMCAHLVNKYLCKHCEKCSISE